VKDIWTNAVEHSRFRKDRRSEGHILIGCNETALKHVPPKCMNGLNTFGVFLSCH